MWTQRHIRLERKHGINEVDLLKQAMEENDDVKGCEHYQRRCKIIAPCCNKIFWCRLCHDTEVVSQQYNDGSSANFHHLDRSTIKKCICDDCGLEQSITQSCQGCKVLFARYFCEICNLWDDDLNKGIWHCHECGLCRRGGAQNFFHCSECDVCVPKETKHKCIPNALRDKCSICLEDMFSSTRLVTYMTGCGHALHRDCLESLVRSGSWSGCCIICKTPLTSGGSQEATDTSSSAALPVDHVDTHDQNCVAVDEFDEDYSFSSTLSSDSLEQPS